jgi:hypothetical protein
MLLLRQYVPLLLRYLTTNNCIPSSPQVHPTLERLFMFKNLAGQFEDLSWSSSVPTAALPLQLGCYGHAPDDAVLSNPGDDDLLSIRDALPPGLLPSADVTNADVLATLVSDSSSSSSSSEGGLLPYVYADFAWSHCEGSNYDIGSLRGTKGSDEETFFSESATKLSATETQSAKGAAVSTESAFAAWLRQ